MHFIGHHLCQMELVLAHCNSQPELLTQIGCIILISALTVTINFVGIPAFEIEYAHWVDEQHKQISELRNALQAHPTDIELRILVENGLNHYNSLFHLKAEAAKADVFYLFSGKWRTSVERFFLWIGGFRPSELLNVSYYSTIFTDVSSLPIIPQLYLSLILLLLMLLILLQKRFCFSCPYFRLISGPCQVQIIIISV